MNRNNNADSEMHQALKRILLGQLLEEDVIAGQNKQSRQMTTSEILKEISRKMHSEEPVQPRTSYS